MCVRWMFSLFLHFPLRWVGEWVSKWVNEWVSENNGWIIQKRIRHKIKNEDEQRSIVDDWRKKKYLLKRENIHWQFLLMIVDFLEQWLQSRSNVAFCVGSWALSTVHKHIIAYELWNIHSQLYRNWTIATNEREVDYWKSEVITLVVEFVFLLLCQYQCEGQGKQQCFERWLYHITNGFF